MKNHRQKHGFRTPYKGLIFEERDNALDYDIGNLKPLRNRVGRLDSGVFEIYDKINCTTTIIHGSKKSAIFTDVSKGHFMDKIRKQKNDFGNFTVKLLNQSQTGIQTALV